MNSKTRFNTEHKVPNRMHREDLFHNESIVIRNCNRICEKISITAHVKSYFHF